MRILQKSGMALLLIFIFLLSISVVSAAQRRIQVDMSEVVDMNVSYGQDFVDTGVMTETIQFCSIDGTINVSNPLVGPGDESVSDIVIWLNNTDNVDAITYLSGRSGSVDNSTGDYVLHVNELRPGNWTVFNYTINCSPGSGSDVTPPLNVSTNYSSEFSGITSKVLAGHDWTINQSARNSLSVDQPINDINITMTAQVVDWNTTSYPFTFGGLFPEGDNDSVTNVSDTFWYWEVSGGTLGQGNQTYIVYNMTAPMNVPTSGTYLALTERLSYSIAYLASDLNVVNITGVADLDIYVGKEIIRPSDNLNNTNVTWRVDANVTVPANLSYNLTMVSLWVTHNVSPIATALPHGFGYINTTYDLNQEINQSIPWDNAGAWLFNYTDGSDGATSPAPIVWMKPYFTIMPNYGQIYVFNTTQDGNDYYMKYIYVVNGYWLQVNKNITSIDDDTYLINTTVENIGNAWTPEGLAVTVYDFVPVNFMPKWGEDWSRPPSSTSNQTITTSEQFNGTSYMWAIPPISPYNASLGPNTEAVENRTWNVWYYVNGTGDYKVSELYIVGLDPRKVDGAGTHEGISLISGFGSNSREAFYVLIVFFLIVINVVNFVMTRRINDKLNSHRK